MKYFGTDGIRGVVNENLDYMLAYNVGRSLAMYLENHNKPKIVIIGKDTRISGDLLTYAVASGLCDYGVTSKIIGIVPTACVSYLSSKLDVGAGVMITASHNKPDMNGIKLINNLGYKFSINDEEEIEKNIISDCIPVKEKGKIEHSYNLVDKYINFLCTEVGCDLGGINIAIDTAYGSNYKIAENVLKKLNANIVCINNIDDGHRINVNCGALNVDQLKSEVKLHSCEFGFAFDGDADRLIVVLKDGRVLDGDEIMFVIASYLLKKNKLNSLTVVGTIMTNIGVEKSFQKIGINLVRTDVGDRNVIEKMRQNNFSLGGESSGHISVAHLNTTCDALANALYLLKIVIKENINLEEFLLHLQKTNQTIINIEVTGEFKQKFESNTNLKKELAKTIKNYPNLKIIVRPSGTENLIRIMVDGDVVESINAINEIKKLFIN